MTEGLTPAQREIIANIRREFAEAGITPEQNKAIWLFCLFGKISDEQFRRLRDG